MTVLCLRCGGPAEGRFRLVMGKGRMERLCASCAEDLSALVRLAGESCQLSLANPRFSAWLDSGHWTTRDGRSLGQDDIPREYHAVECPCCATFAEEED
jgi:hypothetical protein